MPQRMGIRCGIAMIVEGIVRFSAPSPVIQPLP